MPNFRLFIAMRKSHTNRTMHRANAEQEEREYYVASQKNRRSATHMYRHDKVNYLARNRGNASNRATLLVNLDEGG